MSHARLSDPIAGLAELRESLRGLAADVPVATGARVTEDVVASIRCLVVEPRTPARGTILYVHGGAFCLLWADPYVAMASHLAESTRCTVIVPDYDLSPEAQFPIQILQVAAVFAEVSIRAPAGDVGRALDRPLVMAGDSAGANITLAVLELGVRCDLPVPDLVVLFSPWIDLTLRSASVRRNADVDTELDPVSLAAYAQAYAGSTSLHHPLLAPWGVGQRSHPPIMIWAGADELLADDARVFATAATRSGEATLNVVPGMQHNFPFWGPLNRAAMDVYAAVGARVDALVAGD